MKPYYEHGGIQIFNADCREILPHLKGDAVITDPPYGVGLKYGRSYEDEEAGYREWILPIFEQMREAAPLVLLTTGLRHMWLYPPPTWALCWAKPGSTRRSDLGGFNNWEPVLMYGKRRIYQDFCYLPTAPNLNRDTEGHPCPKPLKLFSWIIGQTTDSGALVIDPFLGSGTTLVAAKQLGRRAIGIEIEEPYCEIAARRLQQEVFDFSE